MKVLVTGATGFVGKHLLDELQEQGFDTKVIVRSPDKVDKQGLSSIAAVRDLSDKEGLLDACIGIDVIVHLAGIAHVMGDGGSELSDQYYMVNVVGTRNLLNAAVEQGVGKFIFMSSVKVLGESTAGAPYTENSVCRPLDEYACSKMEAEKIVEEMCVDNGIDWAIVRPPLIYGPGVKANFFRLMRLVKSGMPLPLGMCNNRRSLVYVGNLTSLIIRIIRKEEGPDCTLLISDGKDLSVAQLIRKMGNAIGSRSVLLPVPISLLLFFGMLFGSRQEMLRLTQALEVDIGSTCRKLDWQPPYSVEHALQLTMQE